MCFILLLVSCLSLVNPSNGAVSCSLGDDGVPSYEDTCSFTCDTGYELIGNDTRTCQSDGSWSGSIAMCRRGTYMVSYVCVILIISFVHKRQYYFRKVNVATIN